MDRSSLTADDWLDLALDQLRTRGYGALKAQRLANMMNVTRGSFYYHFENLDAFHEAVIAHWAKRTSGPLVETLGEYPTPQSALLGLLRKTLQSGEALERAVRSWATVQREVAIEVEKVDRSRIEATERLLKTCGLSESDASARSRLLYWAAIGRLMMPFPDSNRLTVPEIVELSTLMLTMHDRSGL